ncbi:site-specific recombinase [Variovorax sp. J22R133]|uniref:site-specific recombinase n=1 Tax=Variovorax brevis TaxID=3053503 RepID=UPI0025781586|nr:site-specific recombinase [Variovorax sp. J22R133]MDM0117058.1 site-specific recombinase [Variovorax sp. J22R133]
MTAAARDLPTLLARLDPDADTAHRHVWLIELFDWLRGDRASPQAVVGRVGLLLDAIQARPEVHERARAWWRRFTRTVDLTTLYADHGFAPRTSFLSELNGRIRRKVLPGTPETTDASELFRLLFTSDFDAKWIALLDEATLARIREVIGDGTEEAVARWRESLLDAVTYCASQVVAAGFSPELRLRMNDTVREARPFHVLLNHLDDLRDEAMRTPVNEEALQAAFVAFRERLDACRAGAASVYTHLEDNGISVGLVFRLRELRERVVRIRELLDCVLSSSPSSSVARLIARLVIVGGERNSVRGLIATNSSLLAAKMAERSAETGEQYITRDRATYGAMVRKAAGGGALTSLTVAAKFAILALGLSAFWTGAWAGVMYAVSFVAIQLLHLTLATKQPAMTAPAMAAKLRDIDSDGAMDSFVDEVANLVRSQVAAVLGNVLVVIPAVMLVDLAMRFTVGHSMIDEVHAREVLHSLSLAGPTALFAAFTGVLLFASSLVAGWVENAFVLHRLDSAMRYNPRISAVLGSKRAQRWATFMRNNISGFASNISLGLMLGLVPAFAAFFGVGLDVRHVTLSSGQIAAACSTLGLDVLRDPALWWAVASIPLIGALNVGVSFYLAFRLALRAHSINRVERRRIQSAIFARWRKRPASFLVPVQA